MAALREAAALRVGPREAGLGAVSGPEFRAWLGSAEAMPMAKAALRARSRVLGGRERETDV